MALPTSRAPMEVISSTDINAIATQVNANETALDGKAATSHTHTLSQVTDLPAAVVPVIYTGSAWPSRPTVPSGSVVLWIGNPGGSEPAEMVDNDVWTQG